MKDGDETDRALRRYYNGELHPRPKSSYAVGWALYDAGLSWCSGPVAVLAAGHTGRFFLLLAALSSSNSKENRLAALRFAFASMKAAAPMQTYDDAMGLHEMPKQLGRDLREKLEQHRLSFAKDEKSSLDHARSALILAAERRDAIEVAWKQSANQSFLGRTATDFQDAASHVLHGKSPEAARVNGALATLQKAIEIAGSPEEECIVRDLILVSPIATLKDYADSILHARGVLP